MTFSSLKTTFVPLDENMTEVGVSWENNRKKWLITKIKRSFFSQKLNAFLTHFKSVLQNLKMELTLKKFFFVTLIFRKTFSID